MILVKILTLIDNEVIDHNAQSVKDHLHKIQLHTGKIQIQVTTSISLCNCWSCYISTTSQCTIHY